MYLLSMANGMDQYLANRLTSQHVIQVVTDPQRADAIFTDRLGEPFEDKLDELYPPPETEEPTKTAEKPAAKPPAPPKEGAKDKETNAQKPAEAVPAPPLPGFEPVNKLPRPASTFGRARGTLFLVDIKSRQVLWSIYERPKDMTPHNLDRAAQRIVERLRQDMVGKSAQP